MTLNKKNIEKKRKEIINKLLIHINEPQTQIDIIKHSSAMTDPKLWKMICELFSENCNSNIKKFIEEGNILRNIHENAINNANKYINHLSMSWETILASFSCYLEYNYFKSPDDNFFDTNHSNLVSTLQRVSQEKVEANREQWGGKKALNRAFELVKKRLSQNRPLDAYVLFDAWNDVLEVESIIDSYCFKGWELAHNSKIVIQPVNISIWKKWEITNHKFKIIDLFYQLLPFFAFQDIVKTIQQESPNKESAFSHIYGLSGKAFLMDMIGELDATIDGTKIDLGEAIYFMKIFDDFYKNNYIPYMKKIKDDGCPYEQSIIESEKEQIENNIFKFIKNGNIRFVDKSEIFKMVHFPCIVSRTQEEMTSMMTQYDPIEPDSTREKSCEVILSLFSSPPHSKAMDNAQFLRAPDKSFIVMPRLYHGDVKTTLYNSLIRKNEDNKIFSLNMEKSIESMFRSQDYSTILNFNYSSENNLCNGEIDVLAYKDNHLIIIEAKLTYFRNQTHSIYEHRDNLFTGAQQLERALKAIKSNYDEISDKLKIKCSYDSLSIFPLIVSSSPEFDFDKFSNIYKTSFFELKGLLFPEMLINVQALIELYNKSNEFISTTNQIINNQETQNLIEQNFSLEIKRAKEQYSSEANLIAKHPQKLVNAIKSRVFWKKLESNPAIIRGPVKHTLTLKNGDRVHYVI
ncbi:hypothetical protein [Desulfomicrobium salsuginis]